MSCTDLVEPAAPTKTSRRRFLVFGVGAIATPLVISACSSSCYSKAGDAAASCESRIASEQRIRAINKPPGR